MHILILLLVFGLSTTVWSQNVLTITPAKKSSPIAPYAYYFEDLSHKLTYEQVSHFPLDSFQPIHRQGAIQLGIRLGTLWLRLKVQNQTRTELFLFSSQWKYKRMDVYVLDENSQLILNHGDSQMPFANRRVPISQSIVSIGYHPRLVHLALSLAPQDFCNDYLQLTDMGYAMRYQKEITFWQGGLTGVYGLTFLFALVFFIRFRDPLIGWYVLFVFMSTHWFLDRSGYMLEFFGQDSWYAQIRSYYPLHLIFVASWVIFLVKFVQLRKYSKSLYYLIIGWISLDLIDYPFTLVTGLTGQYYGQYYTPLRTVFHWIGIEYTGYAAITLSFLLISIIYVSLKDFQTVRWYALAFSVGLISMIISILALFDIPWLPHYPFNNFYFIGSLIEIIILGFVLAERANRHRNEQSHTQQQLIAQLQENLTQKNKLLQIRDEIARDLHDEVGATLTSIAISTKFVQKKVNGQQPDVVSILEQIQTDSQDTITAIRDTVWALNPDNDTSEKLFERLRSVAFQLLANQAVDLTFENSVDSGTLPPFSMAQRRHIYFVFKEALHNIAKHAQATTVSVHIFREPDSIFIRIADNGHGFEPTLATEGNGLKIIQKRANEGGFSVRVGPKPGKGTAVELRIPFQKTTHIGDGVVA